MKNASDQCLHQLFEEQAARSADSVVVLFEGKRATYRDLNCRANQIARCLISLGVRPDSLVGLHVERSVEMVIGLLAIMKAGAAYVPLDPSYPPNRLRQMIKESRLEVLLSKGLGGV